MMRALIAAFVALCGLAYASDARAFHNEPSSFRNIPWGAPVDQVRGKITMWFHRDVGLGVIEYRSRDDLSMASVPLVYNFYQFYQGRFSGAVMEAYSAQCDNMMKVLVARFGAPDRHASPNRYSWHGETTTIAYSCNHQHDYCRVGLVSTKILAERDNAISGNIEKEGTDF